MFYPKHSAQPSIIKILAITFFVCLTNHQSWAMDPMGPDQNTDDTIPINLTHPADENFLAICRNCTSGYKLTHKIDGKPACQHQLCGQCLKGAKINKFFYNSDEMSDEYWTVRNYSCSLCRAWIIVGFNKRHQSDNGVSIDNIEQ